MATERILVKDLYLVFGLEWLELDPMESKHAQIQDWRSRGMQWSAKHKTRGHTYFGLASDSLDTSEASELLSGAAILAHKKALAGQSALVLLAITDDHIAVCGLIAGRIVLDTVAKHDELGTVRASYVQMLNVQGDESAYQVWGTTTLAQTEGHQLQWDDLYVPKSKRRFDDSKIRPFKSERADWIVLAGLLSVLVAGCGAWYWSQWSKARELEERAAIDAQNTPQAKYSQYLQQLFKRQDAFISASSGMAAVHKAVEALPVHVDAWVLDDAVCQFTVPPLGCKIKYKRGAQTAGNAGANMAANVGANVGGDGTYESFFANFPQQFTPAKLKSDALIKGSVIEITQPLDPKRTPMPSRTQWPTYRDFLLDHGSRYQRLEVLGFGISLTEPLVQSNVVPERVAQAMPDAIYSVNWTIANKPWWMHEALNESPISMDIQSVRLVHADNGIQFFAEGKVYVSKTN